MIIFKVRRCAVGGTTLETVRTAEHETSVLKTLCCYKKVTAWAVPMVMLRVIVMSSDSLRGFKEL
jgi:hypothetical protein